MYGFILLLHILFCLALLALVLLQQGKGADMGAAFGSGSANTLFGSRGPASFLFKLTLFFAILFFATSMILTIAQKERMAAMNALTPPPVSSSTQAADHINTFIPPQPNLAARS